MSYLKRFIAKTETFLRNVRWRTYFFLNPEASVNKKDTYGFRSTRAPPQIPELKEFEEGMMSLIQSIKFNNNRNPFQTQLHTDVNKIKTDTKIFVAADKTNNFYKLEPDEYNKLLQQNITKVYKKAPPNTLSQITSADKMIASKLEISDRIDTAGENQAFITLKDHKPNFSNKPTCRLINPSKSEIGKISKHILERINSKVIQSTGFNQWKNTSAVIDWFSEVQNKHQQSFIAFDICEFYPSITADLLHEALEFASNHTNISPFEKHIIFHTKKSMLFDDESPWCKRTETLFDVTMGSFDGAETCELVGLYLLSQLQHININVGLYRDDGLAVCKATPRQTEIIKKELCRIFANNKLKLEIEANKKVVNFLDLTLDLRTGTYKPYLKPNNTPLYVHKQSNHPPLIINNIPESINKRLSSISSNENAFNTGTPIYQEALQKSGYSYQLKYKAELPRTSQYNKETRRRRTRNITWFNPPYSDNVTTNIGKKFFSLLNNCFPPGHKLHRLLNKNTVKLSYSCMANMDQVISAHNKYILAKQKPQPAMQNNCNCRMQSQCPLEGKCLTDNIVYQATVTRHDNHKEDSYIGLTENTFKTRYTAHKASFKHKDKRNATTLSEYIWKLKDANVEHSVKWKLISKARAYTTSSKTCNLCLEEKFFIIHKPSLATLNKRNELISSCRHRNKHLLCNYSNR